MTVLCDESIADRCNWDLANQRKNIRYSKAMIENFVPHQVREVDGNKILSYGLSSGGYDVRIGRKFKIFTNVYAATIDPLAISDKCFIDHEGDFCIIPPNSYVLGVTVEYFNIPKDVIGVCVGKSTYARSGAIINVTPIEPGFQGEVVIEIANQTPLPLKIYANQGIGQLMFHLLDRECTVGYNDRKGKYQGQRGITLPKG